VSQQHSNGILRLNKVSGRDGSSSQIDTMNYVDAARKGSAS
jgi:hypothetical protein